MPRGARRYTLEDWKQKERDLQERLDDFGDITGMTKIQPFKGVIDQLIRCRQHIRQLEAAAKAQEDLERDEAALEQRIRDEYAAAQERGDEDTAEFWYILDEVREERKQPYNDEGELKHE